MNMREKCCTLVLTLGFFLPLINCSQSIDGRHDLNFKMDLDHFDVMNTEIYSTDLFQTHYFPTNNYSQFIGGDEISMSGSAISIDTNHAAVGSYGFNVFSGQVVVYAVSHIPICTWSVPTVIRSPVAGNINFGVSVALDGPTLVVGANAYDFYTGVAYVYSLTSDNLWGFTKSLLSPAGPTNGFGSQVRVCGSHVMVATVSDTVYMYENLNLTSTLRLPSTPSSIALSAEFAVIGMETHGSDNHGLVHVYRLLPETAEWVLMAVLQSERGSNAFFGHSVAVAGTSVVVGAPGVMTDPVMSDTPSNLPGNTGWVYVFDMKPEGNWTLSQTIESPCGQNGYFGSSVAIDDDDFIVGASGYPAGASSGAAFVFKRNTTVESIANWELDHALASTTAPKSQFGSVVDISRMYAMVGAFSDGDLQGSSTFVCRPQYDSTTHKPSPPPTTSPTAKPSVEAGAQNIGAVSAPSKPFFSLGVIIALALVGGVILFLLALCYYCCFMMTLPPAGLKKKPEEDDANLADRLAKQDAAGEGSLFDALSAKYGQSSVGNEDEVDVSSAVYSKDFLASYDEEDDLGCMLSMSLADKKNGKGSKGGKGGKGSKKDGMMTEEELHAKYPYKVHSYVGYEGDRGFSENQRLALKQQTFSPARVVSSSPAKGDTKECVAAEVDTSSSVATSLMSEFKTRPTVLKVFNKPREMRGGISDGPQSFPSMQEQRQVNNMFRNDLFVQTSLSHSLDAELARSRDEQALMPLGAPSIDLFSNTAPHVLLEDAGVYAAKKGYKPSPSTVSHSLSSDSSDLADVHTRRVPSQFSANTLRYHHQPSPHTPVSDARTTEVAGSNSSSSSTVSADSAGSALDKAAASYQAYRAKVAEMERERSLGHHQTSPVQEEEEQEEEGI